MQGITASEMRTLIATIAGCAVYRVREDGAVIRGLLVVLLIQLSVAATKDAAPMGKYAIPQRDVFCRLDTTLSPLSKRAGPRSASTANPVGVAAGSTLEQRSLVQSPNPDILERERQLIEIGLLLEKRAVVTKVVTVYVSSTTTIYSTIALAGTSIVTKTSIISTTITAVENKNAETTVHITSTMGDAASVSNPTTSSNSASTSAKKAGLSTGAQAGIGVGTVDSLATRI
ncbi:hypothetical protein E2P81_ATG01708 [Venturia nashicola]|nr:hypothetical protein E2P81_ATG01708 [Venturia nashicola]